MSDPPSSDPPKGLEGLFKMDNLMRMAQDLQKRLQEAQGEVASLTATASSGGGLVTATVDGRHRVLSLRFDAEVVSSEELEVLQDLVVAAVNMAMEKVDVLIQERMSKETGGIPVPFQLPGLGG